MDGAGCSKTAYQPGIGPARSEAICTGKMNMIAALQALLNERGSGQNLILNGAVLLLLLLSTLSS